MKRPQWVNDLEASKIVGCAVQTLRNDRYKRRGIPYSKVGASVRYKLEDIEQFMESKKITLN